MARVQINRDAMMRKIIKRAKISRETLKLRKINNQKKKRANNEDASSL